MWCKAALRVEWWGLFCRSTPLSLRDTSPTGETTPHPYYLLHGKR